MTKELLQKFMSNSCSEEELEYIYHWMSDPANKEEVSAIIKVSWDKISDKMPEGVRGKDSFIKSVLESSNSDYLQQDTENKSRVLKTKLANRWTFFKVAASVILIIGLSFVTYQYVIKPPVEMADLDFMEKSNPKGRKSTLILPDGSKVKLNSHSKIRYAKKFTSEYREVILEGEAFFEVEKDRTRPFIVKTGDITTTVLGTSFNISAYAKRDEIQVAVVTGKVEVKKSAFYADEEASVAYLTPTKMATYQRGNRNLETSTFNMEEVIGWKDGILIFKNADINQIATKLNEWYGLEVEIEKGEDVEGKRYTGKFDNNSLEYVLKAISYTSDILFEIENNKVILKQK